MNQAVCRVRWSAVTQSAAETGFTLIELMVVVLILGILSSIAIGKYQDVARSARAASCRTNLAALSRALNMYAAQNGRYPSAGQPQYWRGFSGLEGYLAGADSYKCPLTGSTDYRYRLFDESTSYAVRGWFLSCYGEHGHIYDGNASWR